MRILSTFDNSQSVAKTSQKAREARKGAVPEGMEPAARREPERLSRSQILARLEQNKNGQLPSSSNKAAQETQERGSLARASWDDQDEEEELPVEALRPTESKESEPIAEAAKREAPAKEMTAEEAETKANHLMKSDVGVNDPNDETTREKLKNVLSSGGFQFSEKERATLGQILG